MPRNIVVISYDFDFLLFGIVTAEKDYRLCHFINKTLNFDLQKNEDVEIRVTKKRKRNYFTSYFAYDEETRTEMRLISNHANGEQLIPEMKQMDFLLVLKGILTDDEQNELLAQLQTIPAIQLVMKIEVDSLKSKKNLVF